MKRNLFLLLIITWTGAWAQAPSFKKSLFSGTDFSMSRSSGGFDYTLTTLMEPYTDLVNPISINNNEVWDDPEYIVPIAFPFELNGNEVSVMQFAGLGAALLGETADPDVFTVLLPFEADLIDRGDLIDSSLSPISYLVEGATGSRIQKFEFKNAGSFEEVFGQGTANMFINLQFWLYEGSNMIELRFGPQMIDDPDLFYFGETGALIGLSDANFVEQILINPHFIAGDATKPFLFPLDVFINGTPPNGMVYRLTRIDPLMVTVTGMDATSVCNPNGSAFATASGGVTPYTYLWSTGATTDSIFNLAAGTYGVTVVDDQGDSITGSVTIQQPEALLANAAATDETTPDANDGTASVAPSGGTPPYAVLWNTGSTDTLITGLAPGTYTATVTDDAGCTAEQSVIVNAAECLTLIVESVIQEPSCHGLCDGSVSITGVQGGSQPFTYIWSTGEATASILTCAGNPNVTIIDNNGCIVIAEFAVGEPDPLLVNAGSTDETGLNRQDGTAWASPTGGTLPYTYAWSNGSADSLVLSLAPGTYEVIVTDGNNCADTQAVTILPYICTGTISVEAFPILCHGQCDGGLIVFSNAGPNVQYLWSTSDTTNGLFQLCAGLYSVTITNPDDDCVYIDTLALSEPEALDVQLDEVIHLTDTSSASISITVSGGTPPYAFLWAADNGYSGTGEDLTDIDPGTYAVVITDANNCQISIDTIHVLDMTTRLDDPFEGRFRVYPNPVRDLLYINSTEGQPFEITLLHPDGRMVHERSGATFVPMQDMAPGVYFIRIISGSKQWTRAIIKS